MHGSIFLHDPPSDPLSDVPRRRVGHEFVVRKGPIFANFLLTDEINRAPAKVQSALLEAMQKEKVSIDEKLLTQIANETGGKYFRATDNESLESIYKEIDRLEKSKYQVQSFTHYTEKFFPFLLAAVIAVFLEWLLRFTLFRKFP